MNVYQKLAEARFRVLAAGMKMSGENKFAHYKYFELKDIIPVATPVFRDLGLLTVTGFDTGSETIPAFAKMVVINAEKPDERIEFVTPVSYEPVKGTPIIQAIGAAHTYMRRYLYLLALDISECDGINATDGMPGEEKPAQKKTAAKPSKAAAEAPQEKPKAEENIQTAPDWASTLRALCGKIATIQKVSAKVVYDELEKKVRQPATAETSAKYILLAEQTLAAMKAMTERGESDG